MSRLENNLINEIWMERVKQHRPKQLQLYSFAYNVTQISNFTNVLSNMVVEIIAALHSVGQTKINLAVIRGISWNP